MDGIGFPKELLMQSSQDKIEYFRNYTLVHPHLEQAYENLLQAIKYATPGSLIFLYGPSGVGKTTLIQKLYKDIFDAAYLELIENPCKLPAILVRAIAADGLTFDWKDYFQRLLIASNDFISGIRINDEVWEDLAFQTNKILESPRDPTRALKKALENNLKHRKPLGIFIDEAQEIGAVGSSRKLLRQTNVLKSMAEETKINHILSGTYELLPLRNLNGQTSRRSIEIHLPRYDAHDLSHRKIFRSVLRTFQRHLPFEKTPDLVIHWEVIYERSIGCVGTVKDWLTRSLSWALEKQHPTLTLPDLMKRVPSIAQSSRSLEEILEGELNLKNEQDKSEDLRAALGLNIPEHKLPTNKKKISKNQKRSIGIPGPKRYSIKKKK